MKKQYSAALKQYRLAELVLTSHEHLNQDALLIELLRSSAFYQKGDLANAEAALKRTSAIGIQTSEDITKRTFFECSLVGSTLIWVKRKKVEDFYEVLLIYGRKEKIRKFKWI